MATIRDGGGLPVPVGATDAAGKGRAIGRPAFGMQLGNATPAAVYKMIGEDKNTNGLHDTWVVTGTPDYTGASYAGALATPLRNVAVCG